MLPTMSFAVMPRNDKYMEEVLISQVPLFLAAYLLLMLQVWESASIPFTKDYHQPVLQRTAGALL